MVSIEGVFTCVKYVNKLWISWYFVDKLCISGNIGLVVGMRVVSDGVGIVVKWSEMEEYGS